MKVTPLQRFLRAMNRVQKDEFASAVGTTRVYLHQLASQREPNPRLRLSLAICKESQRLSKGLMTPPLQLGDLLMGTEPE
jgi:DNA-binding XRE family transcriptional regulator